MKVSVIVPLFNKARWVLRALESISAQTFRDFECIVVDDGSTDGSTLLASQHPDPRFRLVRQPNGGPGAARNRGIAESRGELLAFLDADDEWDPGYLEASVRALEEAGSEAAAVAHGHVTQPAGSAPDRMWDRRGVFDGLFRATPDADPMNMVHRLAYLSPCATVIRASVVQRHGGFFAREGCRYAEDAYFFFTVLLNEAIVFRRRPLVTFHTDASSLSHNYTGPRPVEPFLLAPEELELSCPRPLKPLLRRMLSIRASKTACVLAFWGLREEALELLRRFEADRTLGQPWAVSALLATSPLGQWAGSAIRGMKGLRHQTPEVPETVQPEPRIDLPMPALRPAVAATGARRVERAAPESTESLPSGRNLVAGQGL